jgi:tripartite-type tricarboxylate transporter receptor subunit TctC
LHDDDVKENFLAFGVEVVGSSPEEFARIISTDITRMKKVIGGTGITAD